MKNWVKLSAVAVFGVFVLGMFLNHVGATSIGSGIFLSANPTPTPPKNANSNTKPANAAANTAANSVSPANTAANMAANSNMSKPGPAPASDKKIPKTFRLGLDSLSEYGEAAFDHETHAFKKYSPDGKSVMACVECHHTDQPKSALSPPLLTSERDVTMTFEVWQASSQKVTDCRACHFQDGDVPDGKVMPTATYTDGGKSTTKDLNNQLAYHINCNTCHDAAFKLRPELKQAKGFATSKDCAICHVTD